MARGIAGAGEEVIGWRGGAAGMVRGAEGFVRPIAGDAIRSGSRPDSQNTQASTASPAKATAQ